MILNLGILQEARQFKCHLCPYSCKVRGNLDKHLRGKHKLSYDTYPDLLRKVMQEGEGYKEYLERLRKVRDGETIALPTPSSLTNMASIQGGSGTRKFQARYDGTSTSLTARTPYFSVPIGSYGTEESLVDNCFDSVQNVDNAQSEPETEEKVDVFLACVDNGNTSGRETEGCTDDNSLTYMDNDQNRQNS